MELASVFCDGLVLQANKTNYIFGYGKGEVKVGFKRTIYCRLRRRKTGKR